MPNSQRVTERTVEKLQRQQAALAAFGSFAFRETDLQKILTEAARICAASLEVPFCKVCRYRPAEDDLLIVAGCGWKPGVIGGVVSQANETSPQGRAYVTGKPVIIRNIITANDLALPEFYAEHGIISTVDVVIPGFDGKPFGVLEIDSPSQHQYDVHDINFLTGFANVLAEAVATATRVQALRESVEQKNLLAEELQHRVRNNLQMLASMLSAHARDEAGVAGHSVDAMIRQVTILAQVYDSLLGVGLSKTIDFAGYLDALCVSMPGLQGPRAHSVAIHCRADRLLLDLDAVTSLGIVVAELITNSYGHAFPDRDGQILIDLALDSGGKTAMLTIHDDGIGYRPQDGSSRRGLSLCRRIVARIGGTLELQPGAGTLWAIGFPAAA
ncbi:GAF domain-containing protein [Plastoroseomonas arctica]|uniref:histidine kinase n=1 Tax=Plastoroseomonas arctica TaxID=1509237 RepID=A0AAF1JUX8_9PROT|nr:GAF domain-containing protein [Plastoroseomonas arctica]MBR0653642.1 GAF domain-containing protein [Plastoroseomonas arctica]